MMLTCQKTKAETGQLELKYGKIEEEPSDSLFIIIIECASSHERQTCAWITK